jgi:hypothetical protein
MNYMTPAIIGKLLRFQECEMKTQCRIYFLKGSFLMC